MARGCKNPPAKIKKTLDKPVNICYNKSTKEIKKGEQKMKVEYINLNSQVCGRRNYVIRVHMKDKEIKFAGGFGEARRKGLLCEYVSYIVEHEVVWLEYTYKKDFDGAIEVLRFFGYR